MLLDMWMKTSTQMLWSTVCNINPFTMAGLQCAAAYNSQQKLNSAASMSADLHLSQSTAVTKYTSKKIMGWLFCFCYKNGLDSKWTQKLTSAWSFSPKDQRKGIFQPLTEKIPVISDRPSQIWDLMWIHKLPGTTRSVKTTSSCHLLTLTRHRGSLWFARWLNMEIALSISQGLLSISRKILPLQDYSL